MPLAAPARSPRRDELLERAYRHVLEHGISHLSLRPLARAIGSSPRVLLYLFESKDGLVRALLARARAQELELLAARQAHDAQTLADVVAELWAWLCEPAHRALSRLWVEAYGRSLVDPDGPWAGFAQATVEDWLELLATTTDASPAQRTFALALLRGALLDLLATGEVERTSAALALGLAHLPGPAPAAARAAT